MLEALQAVFVAFVALGLCLGLLPILIVKAVKRWL